MPDIQLRFDKDMLVLSAPIDEVLRRQGVEVEEDREFLNFLEPEDIHDALRLEGVAGAQCLVTFSKGITHARLSHIRMEDRSEQLAQAALNVVHSLSPQHTLASIGSTELPLDTTDATSLKQNRDQYAQAARDFGNNGIDAFLLEGFGRMADMQCALMGVKKVSDLPVMACVDVQADGTLHGGRETLEDAFTMMQEYGANVVGFCSAAPLDSVVELAKRAASTVQVPVMVFLEVGEVNKKQGGPTPENPYYCADTMEQAVLRLRGAGVQFLRATGKATPAYTGALAAVSAGLDVVVPNKEK